MMISEMLYGITTYGILSYRQRELPNVGINEFTLKLQAHYIAVLSNPQQWKAWPQETQSDMFMYDLLKQSYFKARPPHAGLFALMEMLEAAQQVYLTKYRYLHLIKTRITLFSFLALLGRVLFQLVLFPHPLPRSLLALDYTLLLLSLTLLSSGIITMHWLPPNDWLWQGGLSPAAKHWLRYCLLDEAFADDDPLGRRLRALERQQVLQGIDFGRERQQVLRFYRREQRRKIMLQMNNISEALPLFDLFAVGLPAALVLVVPILGFFLHLW